MAKAPAFQFYAADFLTDTAEMTDQEVGVYIRLLAHQWVNGSLNGDPKRLTNGVAIGVLDVWEDIEHKFPVCEDGRRRNPRLEETRRQQEEYRQKQADAGKLGAKKRWANKGDSEIDGGPISDPISDPNDNPNGENMALQSSTSSSSSISTTTAISGEKEKVGEPPPSKNKFSDADMKTAIWMQDQIRILNPTQKQPKFESWANTIRLIRERDGKTDNEIRDLFSWANHDSFWQSNILSPSKLRDKWDKLTLQKNRRPMTTAQQEDEKRKAELRAWAAQDDAIEGQAVEHGGLTYER